MKTSALRACALIASSAMIAACSQSAGLSRSSYVPSSDTAQAGDAGGQGYHVLYSFGPGHDAQHPEGSPTVVGDTLYGTSSLGGLHGVGAFYSIAPGGVEKVLFNFGGASGSQPYSRLIDINGTLYGTTGYGGANNYGTVFGITTAGKERIVHSFGEGEDGELPTDDLIAVGNSIYGTTEQGGAIEECLRSDDGCGTVYRVTTAGREQVLHSFGKGTDGEFATGGVTDVNGTFYGTAPHGGTHGSGIVYTITADGKERILHSFSDKPDGAAPTYAHLIDVNGTFYGTTEGGGAYYCGTVYGIKPDGTERVVHSFNGTDGKFLAGSLVNVGGILYGTTADGGAYGAGVLFSLTTDGTEKVLHSFGKKPDGSSPAYDLSYANGRLIGTTQNGGKYNSGTVFTYKP